MGVKVRESDEKKERLYRYAKYKVMGNITEVTMMERKPRQPDTVKVSADEYCMIMTGEIRKYKKSETRRDNRESLRKTFRKLRDIINTNVVESKNCRWLTFTYAENMTDRERLYEDYKKYWQRFKRYLKHKGIDVPEYITIVEPQARGAWHIHALYIWDHEAPYIPNSDISELWQQGFTKTKALNDVDNVGAYLTAYLADVELPDDTEPSQNIKEVEVRENGKIRKKKILKGGRLNLYPPGINLFRRSRGIKDPVEQETSAYELREKEKGQLGKLTYKKVVDMLDDKTERRINTVYKAYYNSQREKKQWKIEAKQSELGKDMAGHRKI